MKNHTKKFFDVFIFLIKTMNRILISISKFDQ